MPRTKLIRCASRSISLVGALVGVGLVGVACSMQPAALKDSPVAPMRDFDEASAVFEGAENELSAMLGGGADAFGFDPAPENTTSLPYPPPEPRPLAQPTPSPAPPSLGPQPATPVRQESVCTRACKALASMQRAAERVCELTGDDDERCEDVRDRVANARRRVVAHCKRCST